ncbi:MAG: hypothetical protein OEV62_05210 [Actinomycetota bacterium]|nr:hypothetical protein [Actinomycetota bacterium]MDH4353299.1 hypothetical protein [Actinomycetota bacterium]
MPTLRLLPELEEAIRQIPGVRAVSVVTSAQAEPTEVHILASPGKAAKKVVRDVQSLALARYDIDLDHRIVSVVQIEDETSNGDAPPGAEPALADLPPSEPVAPPPAAVEDDEVLDEPDDLEADVGDDDAAEDARPSIAAITVRTSGAETEAEVTLVFADEEFTGSALGAAASHHRPRLVAQATLAALDPLLGVPVEVDSAAVLTVGGNDVALVVLTVSVPRIAAQSVSGSAVLRGDEADAVARAVLDALNRRLSG